MNIMLEWAEWYASIGWPIFPCKPSGKSPITEHGVNDATTDIKKIREWWNKWPDANIGGACGVPPLNIVVIDEDINHYEGKYGDESMSDIANKFGPLPDTWTSLTGGGGIHHIFTYNNPSEIKNGVGIMNGIDIRTSGGYIILPPSIHESGRRYEWELSSRPDEIKISELPDYFISIIPKKAEIYSAPPVPVSSRFGKGERNDGMFRLASSLRAKGLSETEIFAALTVANDERCDPPLPIGEIRRICTSASRYQQGSVIASVTESGEVQIPEFTKADFYASSKPFEFLLGFKGNKLLYEQLVQRMAESAKSIGINGFLKMVNAYMSQHKNPQEQKENNVTSFQGQNQEYLCGQWNATDCGIIGIDRFGMEVVACYHPILPIERLVNVDTGIHKVKLAYRLSNKWQSVIEDKSTISDSRSIISLAKYGINVTSDNSKNLVRFLADVEHQNYDRIPEVASVGRLGWIENYGFSPYGGQLVFDGVEEYRSMFDSVSEHGDYEKWLSCVRELRKNSTVNGKVVRIVLAASFASALVRPMNCLPFFVHIWGGTGAGKSVALMLATSVWANPEIGRYMQTFNSTDVGKEMTAAFCNSLPLVIDELQLVKDQRKDFDRMIYQLTQGAGRTRGKKTGGLQQTPTWRNCIITSGEFPILSDNSGGGSVNRVLELEYSNGKLIEDGVFVAGILKDNYGFAGKIFANKLCQDGIMETVYSTWEKVYDDLRNRDTLEKQAASAAVVLVADRLIDEWIFHDGARLTADDLALFLKPKDEIDQNARAYEFIQGFVAVNAVKFTGVSENSEVWGRIDGSFVSFVNSKFYKILEDEGYNAKAFIAWAKEKYLIETDAKGKTTVPKRVGGRIVRCICLKMEEYDQEDIDVML